MEASDGGRAGTARRGGQLRCRTAHVTDKPVLGDIRPAYSQPHRQPRRHSAAASGLSGGVRWRCPRQRSRLAADSASPAGAGRRRAHVDAPAAAAAAGDSGSDRACTGVLASLQADC